jgi:hypothetical protein
MLPAEFEPPVSAGNGQRPRAGRRHLRAGSDTGADKELRDFAARTLPAIRKHLDTAKSLQSTLLPPAG